MKYISIDIETTGLDPENCQVLSKNIVKDMAKSKNLCLSFSLNDKQQAKFDKWKEAIHIIYGEYGSFKWTISPTAIGNCIEVWSSLAQISLDLTDMDEW